MGRPVIDLIGQKFNRLTVVSRDESKPKGQGKPAYWICKCDCGNTCSVRTDKLRKNEIQSCGCLSKEIRTQLFLKDLTNNKYGKLIVLERDTSKPMGKDCFAYWKCKCDCGNICSVRGDHLRDGSTQSCGCLKSFGEFQISQLLQQHNISYQTQYTFKDLIGDQNTLRFDFAIFNNDNSIKCLIEFQGDQHFRPWGNEPLERFEKRIEYDNKKQDYCKKNNLKLIEITYKEQDKLDWDYLQQAMEGLE